MKPVHEENPWTTLDSEVVYANDWISVRHNRVIRPDGQPGVYGVVHTRIATGVVALTDQLEVYLVGQYRYPTEIYSWEIVEGGTDATETPLEAATRELREEAGLTAGHWEQLGSEIHVSNCFSSEVGFLYLARTLTETMAAPDPTEILQIRKIPFRSALEMVDSGEIKDSLSIIALLRLSRTLG